MCDSERNRSSKPSRASRKPMTLHADLLDQAEHLAMLEQKRPKQASLRRAISTAYYALFHLLVDEASRLFVRDDRLVHRINRVYAHKEMVLISKSFARGEWPKAFDPVKALFSIPVELQNVANAFVNLQQARHDADYNLARTFSRSETLLFIEQAKAAFQSWEAVRRSDLARIFVACFLNWNHWDKLAR